MKCNYANRMFFQFKNRIAHLLHVHMTSACGKKTAEIISKFDLIFEMIRIPSEQWTCLWTQAKWYMKCRLLRIHIILFTNKMISAEKKNVSLRNGSNGAHFGIKKPIQLLWNKILYVHFRQINNKFSNNFINEPKIPRTAFNLFKWKRFFWMIPLLSFMQANATLWLVVSAIMFLN